MAILITCKSCKKRISDNPPECPYCGSTERKFSIDYRPGNRYGTRKRIPLDDFVSDLETARAIEKAVLEARDKPKKPSVNEIRTVDDLFSDYLDWYKLHRRPESYRDVCCVYYAHISRILGKEPVNTLNNGHVMIYKETRKNEKRHWIFRNEKKKEGKAVSNRTINKELSYLSGFLKWCETEKGVIRNINHITALPWKRPIPIILSFEEVLRIIDAAEPFYRAYFLCLYTLGLRISEAANLKLCDIDLATNRIRCAQKGGSDKILPLNPWLISALKQIIDFDMPEKDRYIFLNDKTHKPVHYIRGAIKRACAKAGVTKKVNPHLFRHSVATHLMAKNLNLRLIQKYLGHSQVGTTEWYTHVDINPLKAASDMIMGEYANKHPQLPKD